MARMHYRAEDEPADSRVEYWQHLISEKIMPVEWRPNSGPDFRAELITGEIGALRIARQSGPPSSYRRTSRAVRRADPGLCTIVIVESGEYVVGHNGTQSRLSPGDFTLLDSSIPFTNAHGVIGIVSVTFPRTMLPLHPDSVRQLAGAPMRGDDGPAALISGFARQLPNYLGDPKVAKATRLGSSILDLLSVALTTRLDGTAEAASRDRPQALLAAIYAFIEEHLTDPRLSPELIASAHHISVRYLYKLFEAQGASVAGWIRQRRLEGCRRDLLDPALADRPVSATAARWTFRSPAHFNRVFRAEFGVAPGEYRKIHAVGEIGTP